MREEHRGNDSVDLSECVYICARVFVRTFVYACACVCAHVYACACVCVHVCVCVFVRRFETRARLHAKMSSAFYLHFVLQFLIFFGHARSLARSPVPQTFTKIFSFGDSPQ